MPLLYCLDPLDPRRPDDGYVREAAVADRLGIPWHLIDHDAVVGGDLGRALRRVPAGGPPGTAVYRGWMMTAERYEGFHAALAERRLRLINDPAAYRHCHHLPESYPPLEGATPRSVWMAGDGEFDLDEVMALLRPFRGGPVVVKDFVKSQKHAWAEACFIPSAADRDAVERVVRRFVELQGPDLAGGLVFREFVDLEPVGRHPRSGMPLTREYRVFFLDGRPLLCSEYWDEGGYDGDPPPLDRFTALAAAIRSRFFSMDVAKRHGGDWLVVELGDGQVAGLPDRADGDSFYRGLAASLAS